jgi:hypothetical protein
LGDVGARHFTDIEAVAGLLELFGEHFDVAAIEIEDRLIAQQIHISGRGVEQHLLLGDAQRLARSCYLAFRLARAVGIHCTAFASRSRQIAGSAATRQWCCRPPGWGMFAG